MNKRDLKERKIMKIDGWRYYQHAAIPSTPPHVGIDNSPINNGNIWKIHKGTYLARWTTGFDCKEETNWWYIIKDTPFDISKLKAKRRYEINKGRKNFEVHEINPKDYKEKITEIQIQAYADYPEKYRPVVNRNELFQQIDTWNFYKFYGAFDVESGDLCGYAWLNRNGNFIYYAFHKVKPSCEKKGINAAIVAEILESHEKELSSGCYICDGSRSVSHETHFQDYLEKYFSFRKAYCHLHIVYRPILKVFVQFLFYLRQPLKRLDNISLIHKVNGILKMEEIQRQDGS